MYVCVPALWAHSSSFSKCVPSWAVLCVAIVSAVGIDSSKAGPWFATVPVPLQVLRTRQGHPIHLSLQKSFIATKSPSRGGTITLLSFTENITPQRKPASKTAPVTAESPAALRHSLHHQLVSLVASSPATA